MSPRELDPARCIQSVYNGMWMRSHQCHFKWKVSTPTGKYCTIHNPERGKAKAEERERKENERWKRESRQREWGYSGVPTMIEARKMLEDGQSRELVIRFLAAKIERAG